MSNIDGLLTILENLFEDVNYHTYSMICRALILNESEAIKELADIDMEHKKQGHLTRELDTRRQKVWENLK